MLELGDDGLCCLTEDAAIQPHRGRCRFIAGSSLLCNSRHLTEIQIKMSAFHVTTSHFYHDSY